MNNLLAQGWAVAVTDYPGLGTPGGEQYSVGVAEGHAVLDVLHGRHPTARRGPASQGPDGHRGLLPGRRCGRLGGSAGRPVRAGPAAARGGDGRHAREPAGGRANINASAFFAFLGGAALGFDAAYPARHLLSDLTPAGRAALAKLGTMCQEQALATYAGKRIEDYTKGGINPLPESPVAAGTQHQRPRRDPAAPADPAVPRPRRRGHPLEGRGHAAPPVVREGRQDPAHQLSRRARDDSGRSPDPGRQLAQGQAGRHQGSEQLLARPLNLARC